MITLRIKKMGRHIRRGVALFVIVWLSVLSPVAVLADEAVDAQGNPTGAQEPTGAQGETGTSCAGVGCDVSEEDYAAWEESVQDSGMQGINTNTGEDSTNSVTGDVDSTNSTSISNTASDTTNATATGSTGGNTANSNTATNGITTGDAGIGVTKVSQDNTAVINGSAGLDVSGHNGDYVGDYTVGFSGASGDLSQGQSYEAINDTTGANSTNSVDLETSVNEINEVQNDGIIENFLNLVADTGNNDATGNTSGVAITTGGASVAATVFSLINSTIINGAFYVSVADIFGNLVGDIILPDLAALAAYFAATAPAIVAGNQNTGDGSTNNVAVNLSDTENTTIQNEADITNNLLADVTTGGNETSFNTGGGEINTGPGGAALTSYNLANTTVEGGNWGLILINALNGFFGIWIGDNGQYTLLDQNQTIEVMNDTTGPDSTNTLAVTDERERTTTVTNDATIVNDIQAKANTGGNTADFNTGKALIDTGEAFVQATTIGIANTVVKDAALFIAVVNVFGDWFGNLVYGGSPLLASSSGGTQTIPIEAFNDTTGPDSENTVDINIDRSQTTEIENDATIKNNLTANIDTGTNKTNNNTSGAKVTTGPAALALHSSNVANLTGIALDPVLGLSISGSNDTTGFDSKNTIKANLNDERIIAIDNFADVGTFLTSFVNTGNNEMLMNTLAGPLVTGNIDANVSIQNLLNRVILALAQGGFAAGDELALDAELLNRLTGPLSENTNDVAVAYTLLADIMNRGLVDNILNLIFNTGGNNVSENTLGAATVTGEICFTGNVDTNVNQNSLPGAILAAAGLSGVNVEGGNYLTGPDSQNDNQVAAASQQVVNVSDVADVNNQAGIQATTGNNQMNDNTEIQGAEAGEGCEKKLAEAPEEEQPGDKDEEQQPGGVGGGEGEAGQGGEGAGEEEGKVAAAVTKPRAPRINGGRVYLLERFPVAGAADDVQLSGAMSVPWLALMIAGVILIGSAYHFDQKAKRRQRILARVAA